MICPSRKALFGVDTKNTSIRGAMEQLPSYETSKCNMDFEQFPIGDSNQLIFQYGFRWPALKFCHAVFCFGKY